MMLPLVIELPYIVSSDEKVKQIYWTTIIFSYVQS